MRYALAMLVLMLITQSNLNFKIFNFYIHDMCQNTYLSSPQTPWKWSGTVFARSDAEATIYFIAWVSTVFIWKQRLLIPVATREVIRQEMVDWHHWTILGPSNFHAS